MDLQEQAMRVVPVLMYMDTMSHEDYETVHKLCCSDALSCAMTMEIHLFTRMASHVDSHARILACILRDSILTPPEIVYSAVQACIAHLWHAEASVSDTIVEMLERLASLPAWKPLLVAPLSGFVETRHETKLGRVFSHLWSDTSVQLILYLHAKKRLNGYLQRLWEHDPDTFYVVFRQWPARVRAAVPMQLDESRVSTWECPITHMCCVHPAVASDGRVYERDALLTHMALNGLWSPMTRQPLSLHVFDVYF